MPLPVPALLPLLLAQTGPLPAPGSTPVPLGGTDVPLRRLSGTPTFSSSGVSFLDYDGDGWIDLFINSNAGLWRNDAGLAFTRVADLDIYLPPIAGRYGSSCGDYDNDGLPDIACSPRGDCLYVLHNLGGSVFEDLTADPNRFQDPPSCQLFGETFCWADVDADGDLDLWATAYPDDVNPGSDGNQFFENLGPVGPGGAYVLANRTVESNLGVPDNVQRPEGAQFVDVDRDGDLDAYANGTLYQNVTATDGPRFRRLIRQDTGILFANRLDEGVLFFDHDLDGDQDLLLLYRVNLGLWENRGDGTFVDATAQLEAPGSGATEGCSAEDWDLDGDVDLTTAGFFRRNLLVETGEPFLRLASTAIPLTFLNFCLPAWGDWDKDGDPDCALANFNGPGAFFRNTTYEPDTPASQKTSVRVRPVRDSATVARGLETEFGATVEVRPRGDDSGLVRRRFVASSHGYLQQSEYALTLALPPGPDPKAPAHGVVFDLLVDFPSLEADGIRRVDRFVNPVLGELELASLAEREITVFRSGIVRIDGTDHAPRAGVDPRLHSTGALVLPAEGVPPPELEPVPGPDGWVGIELDTHTTEEAVLVQELVLDGALVPAGPGRCDANVLLFDLTHGDVPLLLAAEKRATRPENRRSFLPVEWRLKPDRIYRVLCRVSSRRASPLVAVPAVLANHGGFTLDSSPGCNALPLLEMPIEPDRAYLELRWRTLPPFATSKAARR